MQATSGPCKLAMWRQLRTTLECNVQLKKHPPLGKACILQCPTWTFLLALALYVLCSSDMSTVHLSAFASWSVTLCTPPFPFCTLKSHNLVDLCLAVEEVYACHTLNTLVVQYVYHWTRALSAWAAEDSCSRRQPAPATPLLPWHPRHLSGSACRAGVAAWRTTPRPSLCAPSSPAPTWTLC